jgi:hypothetical protein
MKRKALVIAICLLSLASLGGFLGNAWQISYYSQKEMEEHYGDIRLIYSNLLEEAFFGIAYPPGGPKLEFKFMDSFVLHDIDNFNFYRLCPEQMTCGNCHQCAKNYLRNEIIAPLYAAKSIRIQGPDGSFQSGKTLYFDELTRLNKSKLLFYWVRDYVDYPKGIELVPEVVKAFKAPCETFFEGKGVCTCQAMALAALLKMEGYDVAIGYVPNIGIPFMPFGLVAHAYVFVRDEGWNIGGWELRNDMFGNPMPGKWILLDPIWSPRHGGPTNCQDYGEDPKWVTPSTRRQMAWGLVDLYRLPQLPLPDSGS